jgi:hypothetical protein
MVRCASSARTPAPPTDTQMRIQASEHVCPDANGLTGCLMRLNVMPQRNLWGISGSPSESPSLTMCMAVGWAAPLARSSPRLLPGMPTCACQMLFFSASIMPHLKCSCQCKGALMSTSLDETRQSPKRGSLDA